MKTHWLATVLVFAALSLTRGAHAQSAVVAPSATRDALQLELDLGNSNLDAELVRKAIELELKRPVSLVPRGTEHAGLSVKAQSNHTVTVSYRSGTGELRTRSIGIPEDSARGAEVIALLSGNLSRDEAAELLASLTAKTAPAAAAGDPAAAVAESAPNPDSKKAVEPQAAPITAEKRPAQSKPAPPSSEPTLIQTPFPAFNLSLFAPVALYRPSERRIFTGELGLFYSHIGELRGVGVNVFALRVERDVRGVTIATFYNDTAGKLTGVATSAIFSRRQQLRGCEVSGLVNLGTGNGEGVAAAGLLNLSRNFEGVQAAGLINRANTVQGVQAAGLVNRSWGLEGVQAAALANFAGDTRGVQAAALINRAAAVTGVQAAGVVNVAQSVEGFQLGVVNVSGEVHGVQLGVVNVAKRVNGTSVGLVSVAENGRVQPVIWASSAQPLNAAAKFIVGPLYTQAGLGYSPSNKTYTYELGLGAHIRFARFFVEPGVHYSEMRGTEQPFDHELIEYGHYRVAAGMDLGKVSPFAGAGVLQRFAHSADAPASVPVTAEVFGGAAFF